MTNENWMTGPSADPDFDSQGITVMTTNQHPTQARTSIMTNQHPITPSPGLVMALRNSASHRFENAGESRDLCLIDKAYAAGANQELEACFEWLRTAIDGDDGITADFMYKARRPKPPSLRKMACDALDTYIYGEPDPNDKERTYNTIRQALEALDDN